MNKISLLKCAFVMFCSVPVVNVAADRVGDFSLLDQAGYYHSMSWYDDHESIALLVQANDSQELESVLPEFMTLKAEYDSLGVEFMMINPQGKLNRRAVAERVAEYDVEIPVLMDDARVISEALGVTRVGDVVLYNPKTFMVDYLGLRTRRLSRRLGPLSRCRRTCARASRRSRSRTTAS